MRKHKERVLINFVRILWWVSSFSGECKFSYTIIKFFVGLSWLDSWLIRRCWNFLRNWCSNIMLPYNMLLSFILSTLASNSLMVCDILWFGSIFGVRASLIWLTFWLLWPRLNRKELSLHLVIHLLLLNFFSISILL